MLTAISSIISKTIDVFLKVNSSEGRRRKFAKQLFEVYSSLDEVVTAIGNIQLVIGDISQRGEKPGYDFLSRLRFPEYIRIRSWSSKGSFFYETLYLDQQGCEQISPEQEIDQRLLLPAILSNEIRALNKAFRKIARIMEAESWELWDAHNQPDKLRALSIYDKDLADTFIHAWFQDGGFIEALMKLGMNHEIEGKVLKLRDAEFGTPQTACWGYEVSPDEAVYDLRDPTQVESFLTFSESCKSAVVKARDNVKEFISKNCAIEDIL